MYQEHQNIFLRNLDDSNKLRAVLLNESLLAIASDLLGYLFLHSKTDNGEAVSILRQDGRSYVDSIMLDYLLEKDVTSMVTALQEPIKAGRKMCHTCSDTIGCYDCANPITDCVASQRQRYCHGCFLNSDLICANCQGMICPDCHEKGNYERCTECSTIYGTNDESLDDFEACSDKMGRCRGCGQRVCEECVLERDPDDEDDILCISCSRANDGRVDGCL